MKKLSILIVALGLMLGAGVAQATETYSATYDASLNKTVLFVGDSNFLYGATQLTVDLVNRANGYLPIFTPKGGMGIRGYAPGFCPLGQGGVQVTSPPCLAPNYWSQRLGEVLATVHPDAIVVNLGINDANSPGTATTSGYSGYAAKMTYMLSLFPPDVPVFWSGLPTPVEPAARIAGCNAVNAAITAANAAGTIHVLRWYTAAYQHPEYMDGIHYTDAGYEAYASMVATALDAQFGQ